MGPSWGPSGADRTQVGPMLAPWTLLSGIVLLTNVMPEMTNSRLYCCSMLLLFQHASNWLILSDCKMMHIKWRFFVCDMIHRNGNVIRMTAPLVTGDVEDKLQRSQWRPGQSQFLPQDVAFSIQAPPSGETGAVSLTTFPVLCMKLYTHG